MRHENHKPPVSCYVPRGTCYDLKKMENYVSCYVLREPCYELSKRNKGLCFTLKFVTRDTFHVTRSK